MVVIRHRTASGMLSNVWEFCPARHVVDMVLRLGSAEPVAFKVPVCSPDRPLIWSHPLLRLDGDSWRLLPAFFVAHEQDRVAIEIGGVPFPPPPEPVQLLPRDCRPMWGELESPCALHRLLGVGTQVILSCAPPNVDAELMELSP